MSQPEISPLARRLAEENNVDWRDLHGSGAGGKVVERDVLEFLARVMAGEEDLDPTPEPVPEGMEAWPEEDVHAFQQEMRASSKNVGLQEIQQELSASDRHVEGASAPDMPPLDMDEPSVDAGSSAQGEDISEDIFLFDDDATTSSEQEPAPAGAAPDDVPWQPNVRAQDGEDALLVAGEEPGGWDAAGDAASDATEEALWGDAPAQAASEHLPDVFGEPEATPPATGRDLGGAALFEDGGARGGAPGEPEELDVPPLGDLDLDAEERGGERFGELHAAAEEERFVSDFEADFDTGFDAPGDDEARLEPGAGVAPVEEQVPVDDGSVGDASGADAPWADVPDADVSEVAPEEGRGEVAEAPQPTVPPFDASPAEVPAEPAAEPRVPADVPPPAMAERSGLDGAGAAGAVPSELPLVSYGTLLRRHLDVTALASAQLAVGLELGEREPLPPIPFLLRAAAKAVADGAWGDGPVAVIGWDERGELRVGRIADPAGRPFADLAREVGTALASASHDAGGVSLAVADMSALEVDEAVLNVDAPLITLGRILYDNQRGSYRSTLSLAGDVPPERGARLLARVAELLDAPVRLLL